MAETTLDLVAANKLIADLSARLEALEKNAKAPSAAPAAAGYQPTCKKPWKKALYHAPFAAPVELHILDENNDETVNLGDANGKIVVRSCPVAEAAKHGHCTRGTKLVTAQENEEEFENLDK